MLTYSTEAAAIEAKAGSVIVRIAVQTPTGADSYYLPFTTQAVAFAWCGEHVGKLMVVEKPTGGFIVYDRVMVAETV